MLTGEPLFNLSDDESPPHEVKKTRKEILSDRYLVKKFRREAFKKLSNDAQDLIKRMLERDPAKRIVGNEAMKHAFVVKCYTAESHGREVLYGKDHVPPEPLPMGEIVDSMMKFAQLPILKQTAYITAAHITSGNEDLVRRAVASFRILDRDGDGQIGPGEIRLGLLRYGLGPPDGSHRPATVQGGLPAIGSSIMDPGLEDEDHYTLVRLLGMSMEDFRREIIAKIDMDRSNNLSFTEFLAACMVSENHPIPESVWGAVFSTLDADGSGALEPEDLMLLFGTHQLEGETAELTNIFSEIPNKEPEDRRITLDDFKQLMQISKKDRVSSGLGAKGKGLGAIGKGLGAKGKVSRGLPVR